MTGAAALVCGSVMGVHAQLVRVSRVGVVAPSPPPPDAASVNAAEALERGLRERGWNPGTNIRLEYRFAAGNVSRMREQVAELIRLPVDVIVARGTQATQIAREGTKTIPIVMSFVADPVSKGFVRSLARPGGSITGLSFLVQTLQGKQLEYLKEASPRISRVAVLGNPVSFPSSQYQSFVKAIEAGAGRLGSIRTSSPQRSHTAHLTLHKGRPMALKTYTGSCHCGAVKYEADVDISKGTMRCNCSLCKRSRAWFAFVTPDHFRLEKGEDAMADYQWTPPGKPRPNLHYRFCQTCGVRAFATGQDPKGGQVYAIAVATLEGVDPEELAKSVKYVDGKHDKFNQAPPENNASL